MRFTQNTRMTPGRIDNDLSDRFPITPTAMAEGRRGSPAISVNEAQRGQSNRAARTS
jgi:hypothetical protein